MLESLDDLQEREYAAKQGVICEEWPFYAGGFATYSSSSSSSSEDDDNEINDGFDDSVETTQCLSTANYCTKCKGFHKNPNR